MEWMKRKLFASPTPASTANNEQPAQQEDIDLDSFVVVEDEKERPNSPSNATSQVTIKIAEIQMNPAPAETANIIPLNIPLEPNGDALGLAAENEETESTGSELRDSPLPEEVVPASQVPTFVELVIDSQPSGPISRPAAIKFAVSESNPTSAIQIPDNDDKKQFGSQLDGVDRDICDPIEECTNGCFDQIQQSVSRCCRSVSQSIRSLLNQCCTPAENKLGR